MKRTKYNNEDTTLEIYMSKKSNAQFIFVDGRQHKRTFGKIYPLNAVKFTSFMHIFDIRLVD